MLRQAKLLKKSKITKYYIEIIINLFSAAGLYGSICQDKSLGHNTYTSPRRVNTGHG